MNTKTIWIIAVVVIIIAIIGGGVWLYTAQSAQAAKLSAFATCVKNSGAKMYGAFWCPHCQDQKAMFETLFDSAVPNLPYVECSTPDSNGQLQVCKDLGIKVYPTWKFADGTSNEGELTLKDLAAKTNCAAPN